MNTQFDKPARHIDQLAKWCGYHGLIPPTGAVVDAFALAMGDNQYGVEETWDAFCWFRNGFNAAGAKPASAVPSTGDADFGPEADLANTIKALEEMAKKPEDKFSHRYFAGHAAALLKSGLAKASSVRDILVADLIATKQPAKEPPHVETVRAIVNAWDEGQSFEYCVGLLEEHQRSATGRSLTDRERDFLLNLLRTHVIVCEEESAVMCSAILTKLSGTDSRGKQ